MTVSSCPPELTVPAALIAYDVGEVHGERRLFLEEHLRRELTSASSAKALAPVTQHFSVEVHPMATTGMGTTTDFDLVVIAR